MPFVLKMTQSPAIQLFYGNTFHNICSNSECLHKRQTKEANNPYRIHLLIREHAKIICNRSSNIDWRSKYRFDFWKSRSQRFNSSELNSSFFKGGLFYDWLMQNPLFTKKIWVVKSQKCIPLMVSKRGRDMLSAITMSGRPFPYLYLWDLTSDPLLHYTVPCCLLLS
jgi:hypothetical protein